MYKHPLRIVDALSKRIIKTKEASVFRIYVAEEMWKMNQITFVIKFSLIGLSEYAFNSATNKRTIG